VSVPCFFITMALSYSLKSGIVIPPTIALLALAMCGLCVYIWTLGLMQGMSLEFWWALHWTYIQLGSTAIFMILNLPIHENRRTFYLLISLISLVVYSFHCRGLDFLFLDILFWGLL
jgi:hypothetical protein